MNRNSEREARQIIENIIAEPEERDLCLSAFAEAIEEADMCGRNKWGISLFDDRVRLNVGQVVVCTIWDGGLWLALENSNVEDLKGLDGFSLLNQETYEIVPSIDGQYTPREKSHSETWSKIKQHHFKLIELAADSRQQLRKSSQEAHSPGVLKYLRRYLNVDLPAPNYKMTNQATQKWTASTWREELERRHGASLVEVFDKFHKWSRDKPYIKWDGSGDRVDDHATLWPWIRHEDSTHFPPMCFRVDGQVEIPFRYINESKHRPFNEESKREELQTLLNQISGIELKSDAYRNGRPTFSLSLLEGDSALNQLFAIFDWYVGEIVGSTDIKTYLLAWNPNRWDWTEIPELTTKLKRRGLETIRWSCGNRKDINQGDRLFWIRLGKEPRGIFASGWVIEGSFEALHWDDDRADAGDTAWYIEAELDALLNPEQDTILTREELDASPYDEMHWDTQKSGIIIPNEIALELEEVWAKLTDSGGFTPPEEVADVGNLYEGATRRISVNAYERNPAARKRCIAHYGATCVVCGFNFGDKYGEVGEGFIHVHHLKPISEINECYIIDPIRDLRPVCPNCHAIIHLGGPKPFTIKQVKELLRKSGR